MSETKPGASMPHVTKPVRYLAVLGTPGAPYAFAAATLGRLSYGTVPLALLFSAQRATGSFSYAGAVIAVFGLASLSMPAKARLVDHFGQPRMLALMGTAYAATLSGFAIISAVRIGQSFTYILLAALAGIVAPPLGPAMRALWALLTETADQRQKAYSVDSVVEEGLYTLGPVITGVLISFGGPVLSLLVTAALAFTGSVGMASSAVAHRTRPGLASTRVPGPSDHLWRQPGLVPVLTAILGAGLCLGAVEVGVAARAQRVGATAATGYLLAALFFGSAIGGIIWGRRTHTRARSTQLVFLLLMLAGGVTIAALMPNLIALGITLMFAGLAVSPAFVVSYLAADQLVPMERRTEASAWVNTANNIGSAVGSAGAGVIVDHGSASIALICGAAIIAPAVLFVLISHRHVDEGRHPPGKQVPEVL